MHRAATIGRLLLSCTTANGTVNATASSGCRHSGGSLSSGGIIAIVLVGGFMLLMLLAACFAGYLRCAFPCSLIPLLLTFHETCFMFSFLRS